MEAMINEIKGLPIGENTACLIACIRTIQDVYGEASNVMEQIYGENVAESIINDKLGDACTALKKGLQECLMMSIDESLGRLTLKSI